MVSPDDVIHIYTQLAGHGIPVWLCGGWGIDALLGEHTRPHKDLDVLMELVDVAHLCELLSQEGYTLKEYWSENLWTTDSSGHKTATAFVLRDPAGRELDVHAFRFDEQGNAIPAWQAGEGFIFTPQDLSGAGRVDGNAVWCQSAENQMICHTGYALPDYQKRDLEQLYEKFGVEYTTEISSREASKG